MKSDVKVLHLKGGITVKITMLKKRYEIEILIPEQNGKKEIRLRNRQVNLFVKFMKICKEPINIKLQGIYEVDSYGQVCIDKWSKFEFNKNKHCNGYISLNPINYIPANIRRKVKIYWDEYKKNAKLIKNLPDPKRKPSTASKYTNYSHNNAGKPYSGGLVSPK